MKTLILSSLFASSLILGCNRAPVTTEDAHDDLKALQGTWTLIYFERDGTEIKQQNDTRAINTGNRFIVKRGDQVIAAGTMKIVPGATPKASETTYTEGADKGKTFKGIYQIEGDTMKFCRAGAPDAERPTEFKSKPNSGEFFAVYTRAPN